MLVDYGSWQSEQLLVKNFHSHEAFLKYRKDELLIGHESLERLTAFGKNLTRLIAAKVKGLKAIRIYPLYFVIDLYDDQPMSEEENLWIHRLYIRIRSGKTRQVSLELKSIKHPIWQNPS